MLNVSLTSTKAVCWYICNLCIRIDSVKGEPTGVEMGVPERPIGKGALVERAFVCVCRNTPPVPRVGEFDDGAHSCHMSMKHAIVSRNRRIISMAHL